MNSVVIKSIDRDKIRQAVIDYAKQLHRQFPEILRIIWFGSWISGHPHPGSDVDLCLVIMQADLPLHERSPQYLPVGFPAALDLLVYTAGEFEALPRVSPALYGEISRGIELLDV